MYHLPRHHKWLWTASLAAAAQLPLLALAVTGGVFVLKASLSTNHLDNDDDDAPAPAPAPAPTLILYHRLAAVGVSGVVSLVSFCITHSILVGWAVCIVGGSSTTTTTNPNRAAHSISRRASTTPTHRSSSSSSGHYDDYYPRDTSSSALAPTAAAAAATSATVPRRHHDHHCMIGIQMVRLSCACTALLGLALAVFEYLWIMMMMTLRSHPRSHKYQSELFEFESESESESDSVIFESVVFLKSVVAMAMETAAAFQTNASASANANANANAESMMNMTTNIIMTKMIPVCGVMAFFLSCASLMSSFMVENHFFEEPSGENNNNGDGDAATVSSSSSSCSQYCQRRMSQWWCCGGCGVNDNRTQQHHHHHHREPPQRQQQQPHSRENDALINDIDVSMSSLREPLMNNHRRRRGRRRRRTTAIMNDDDDDDDECCTTTASRDMDEEDPQPQEQQQQQPLPADTSIEPPHPMHEPEDAEEAQEDDEPPPQVPVSRWTGTRRLLQLARPQVGYLYAGCAVLLVRLPFSLSIPHFVSTTLTAVQEQRFAAARDEILYLILAGSIDAALDFWCVFLFGYANLRIVKALRLDLFQTLIRQDVAFFDQNTSGVLSSRLQSDCSEMSADLTWFFRFSIESVVRITGITLYLTWRCPSLAACALTMVPIVAMVNHAYGSWLRQNAVHVQTALACANAVALEALVNIRTVIALAAEEWELQKYANAIETHYTLNQTQLFMSGVYYMTVSTFLINTLVQALLLYVGSRLVQDQALTAGVLLAFMLYQGQLQNETLNLFQSYSSLIKSSGAGDKVFQLLDRNPPAPSMKSDLVQQYIVARGSGDDESNSHIDASETSSSSLSPLLFEEINNHQSRTDTIASLPPSSSSTTSSLGVELCNVSFNYPTRPHHSVLDHLNLTIPPGTSMAIVGTSGSGKSTLVQLLQRFYEPSDGAIFVNGINLKEVNLASYRRQRIGVVSQEAALFGGSILDNIVYGCPAGVATRANAVNAAKIAFADDFIKNFADGYDTLVGEQGVQLSGGQRQRIAIARAIIKNPSLLLLDEATSALDGSSEQAVQAALENHWLQQRQKQPPPPPPPLQPYLSSSRTTVIIIAHRLRTVERADCIAVLQHGRVVELGPHDALLKRPHGVYRSMVERSGTSGVLVDEQDDPE